MRILIRSAISALLAAVPATAYAEHAPSTGFGISATVPEVCQMNASDVLIDRQSTMVTTSVFEMCNSSGAYRVTATYRTLADMEAVSITYDGRLTPLRRDGASDIALRAGPFVGRREVRFNIARLDEQLSVSFGMTAV